MISWQTGSERPVLVRNGPTLYVANLRDTESYTRRNSNAPTPSCALRTTTSIGTNCSVIGYVDVFCTPGVFTSKSSAIVATVAADVRWFHARLPAHSAPVAVRMVSARRKSFL
jgi:hypothetical protein